MWFTARWSNPIGLWCPERRRLISTPFYGQHHYHRTKSPANACSPPPSPNITPSIIKRKARSPTINFIHLFGIGELMASTDPGTLPIHKPSPFHLPAPAYPSACPIRVAHGGPARSASGHFDDVADGGNLYNVHSVWQTKSRTCRSRERVKWVEQIADRGSGK